MGAKPDVKSTKTSVVASGTGALPDIGNVLAEVGSYEVGPAMAAIWSCGSGDKARATHLKNVHLLLLKQYDPTGIALAHFNRGLSVVFL